MGGNPDVQIDTTFTNRVIEFIQSPSDNLMNHIVEHTAAKKTHSHALRFGNTEQDIRGFWKEILYREIDKAAEVIRGIELGIEYIERNSSKLSEAFIELMDYLPRGHRLQCTLYAMTGYDIGIVSDGDALINLGHKFYQEDPREIMYMAMHELHHVGYTHYDQGFSLSDLRNTQDLIRAIRYATHLEGMATYAPFHRRASENGLAHIDYQVLLEPRERKSRVNEFFEILNDLSRSPLRALTDEDFEIIEVMSGRNKRLWYITGAHVAEIIDKKYGRQRLVQTIVDGPESFFKAYIG
jgi:hypothetical protein